MSSPFDVAQKYLKSSDQTGPSPVDQIIDDRTIAVLIDSTVLGAPIWFAFRDGWTPDEADIPVCYASELPALRMKSPEQLQNIFNVKRAFGGGMVQK